MAKFSGGRKKELIKIKLSEILKREVNDPKLDHATITRVEVSPDTTFAKIYFCSFHPDVDSDEMLAAFNSAKNFIQSKLGKALQTRNTPKLAFVYDAGFDHASDIDHLLKDIE